MQSAGLLHAALTASRALWSPVPHCKSCGPLPPPYCVQCLDAWARSAASDLLLLEALQGAPLLPLQPLADVLPAAVSFDPSSGEWTQYERLIWPG